MNNAIDTGILVMLIVIFLMVLEIYKRTEK
jgi:hypothetical protein